MNRYSINSAVLNDGALVAGSVVFLPSASVTIQRTLSERDSIQLSGTLSLGLDINGYIAKVFVIGEAFTGISLDVAGVLAKYQRVLFDPAVAELNWAPTGALNIRKQLPSALTSIQIDVTGTLDPKVSLKGFSTKSIETAAQLHCLVRLGPDKATINRAVFGTVMLTGGLKASDTLSLVPSGTLAQGKRSAVPAANAEWSITPSGSLRGLFRFHGTTAKALSLAGELLRTRRMVGTGDINLDINGELSNNAASTDPEAVTMSRKNNLREMNR